MYTELDNTAHTAGSDKLSARREAWDTLCPTPTWAPIPQARARVTQTGISISLPRAKCAIIEFAPDDRRVCNPTQARANQRWAPSTARRSPDQLR